MVVGIYSIKALDFHDQIIPVIEESVDPFTGEVHQQKNLMNSEGIAINTSIHNQLTTGITVSNGKLEFNGGNDGHRAFFRLKRLHPFFPIK